MEKLKTKHEVNNYLLMAQNGHLPLFFKEWLNQSEPKSINYKSASKNVKTVFDKLSRHRTIEKMQVAILSMQEEERSEFMSSFFKMVEHNSLKEIQRLQ